MRHPPRQFIYRTPWGVISLLLEGAACHGVRLETCDAPVCPGEHPAAQWLDSYFSGHKDAMLPSMGAARTIFQHRLRHALLEIPAGHTKTYGELAKILNSGPRAVGQALGANPLPILIPCHRIVAAHGLGGFSCGPDWKRRLLEFEESIIHGSS